MTAERQLHCLGKPDTVDIKQPRDEHPVVSVGDSTTLEKRNPMGGWSSAARQFVDWLRTRKRQIATVLLGLALVATGAAATLLSSNGPGSAALVAGGTLLLTLALLDERIALLKVGDIEFHLREAARQLNHQAADLAAIGDEDAAEQLRQEAQSLLRRISPVARAYEEVRRARPPLAGRVAEMSKVVADAKQYSREHHPSAEAVLTIFNGGGDGERLYALALMQADPDAADVESIIDAISGSHSGFEQYHALVAAKVILSGMEEADRIRMSTAISRQMEPDGYISKSTDRRRLANHILKIINE